MSKKEEETAIETTAKATVNAVFDVAELQRKHKISPIAFAGVCAAQNWTAGKQVTEQDFTDAVQRFKSCPMDSEVKKRC